LHNLRVGRFWFVYRVSARRIVEVVTFGPRKAVYEETLGLLRKERTLRRWTKPRSFFRSGMQRRSHRVLNFSGRGMIYCHTTEV